MKYSILTFLFFLINTLAFAQSNKEVSNVRIRIKETKSSLEVTYDAKGIKQGDSLKIEIKSKTSSNIVYPKSLTGDFGTKISSGKDKKISWDMYKDAFLISDSIQVSLSIVYQEEKKKVVPPIPVVTKVSTQNLGYWSILVPGLGSGLVSRKKRIPLRIATAGAVYGLAIGAYLSKKMSNEFYKTYLAFNREVDAQPYYNDANLNNHIYYGTVILGSAIWVTDIISAVNKGRKKHLQNGTKVSLKFDQVQSVATIGLNYQF